MLKELTLLHVVGLLAIYFIARGLVHHELITCWIRQTVFGIPCYCLRFATWRPPPFVLYQSVKLPFWVLIKATCNATKQPPGSQQKGTNIQIRGLVHGSHYHFLFLILILLTPLRSQRISWNLTGTTWSKCCTPLVIEQHRDSYKRPKYSKRSRNDWNSGFLPCVRLRF